MTNEFLRHLLVTMAYRFKKINEHSGSDFGEYKISQETRTPSEILHHVNFVIDKTRRVIETQNYDDVFPEKLSYEEEIKRFYDLLEKLDKVLEKKELEPKFCKKLIQGPLSDTLCHIGQIGMLCGLNGNKIPGENYSLANIETGNIKCHKN